MATLLTANPSLFFATVAALSTNYFAASQAMSTGLPNLQAPSLWSNSTSTSSNAFQPSSAFLLNTGALIQGAATECAYQQQPVPTPCATTTPTMSTVSTATMNAPVRPRLVSSTDVNAQNIIYEQIIWPNMPTKLVVLAPSACVSWPVGATYFVLLAELLVLHSFKKADVHNWREIQSIILSILYTCFSPSLKICNSFCFYNH